VKIEIRIPGWLHVQMVQDLSRRHRFAMERVGFACGRTGTLGNEGKLVLLNRYHPVADDDYIDDPKVGARIGSEAITKAMHLAYYGRPAREGAFHVHMHPVSFGTGMSDTDREELPRLMPGFQSVGREAIHGIVIISDEHASGWVWMPGSREAVTADIVSVIGSPLKIFKTGKDQ
jgi:hypothetical protein